MFRSLAPPKIIIITLALLFSSFIPTIFACIIFAKAGYHWAMGLLVLLPLANIILLIYFALDRWPVLEELDRAKITQNALG